MQRQRSCFPVCDLIRLLCDNQDMDRFREIAEQFRARPREGGRQFLQGYADVCYRTGGSGQGESFWPVYRSSIRAEPLFFLSEKMPPSSAVSGCRWTEREYDWSYEGKLQALKQKMAQQAEGILTACPGVISVLRGNGA